MVMIEKGLYRAKFAQTPAEMQSVFALRAAAFLNNHGASCDQDEFDVRSTHVMIENIQTGRLECCFRMMVLNGQGDLNSTYSGQHYDLTRLNTYVGGKLEVGRFCLHPLGNDPDAVRIAWAAITRMVDKHDISLLFGCSSFEGTDPSIYADAFACLKNRHLAPSEWAPAIKAADVVRYTQSLGDRMPDFVHAQKTLPTLLRTYLLMQGWVSDHAVIDHKMHTLHVFTCVEIAKIPATRKRLLREDAQ